MRLSSDSVHASRPRCRTGQDTHVTRGVYAVGPSNQAATKLQAGPSHAATSKQANQLECLENNPEQDVSTSPPPARPPAGVRSHSPSCHVPSLCALCFSMRCGRCHLTASTWTGEASCTSTASTSTCTAGSTSTAASGGRAVKKKGRTWRAEHGS